MKQLKGFIVLAYVETTLYPSQLKISSEMFKGRQNAEAIKKYNWREHVVGKMQPNYLPKRDN